MEKAIIYFSDKSTLELCENDYLIPIISKSTSQNISASKDTPMELWQHISDGLIPSIMDVFCKCDFFYVNNNCNIIYNSNSIVKIEVV